MTHNDTFSFFEDIVDAPDHQIEIKRTDTRYTKNMLCPYCHGAGCIECGQSGTVTVNPKVQTSGDELRAKRRAAYRKGQDTKRRKLAEFHRDNRDTLRKLSEMSDWNDFARSLIAQAADKPLSEKQMAAAERMIAKVEATRARKAQERAAAAPEVDLSAIEAMFATAIAKGFKRPSYRAEGLYIKLAPANGRNAGALYVLNDEKREPGRYGEQRVYEGKVSGQRFFRTRNTEPTTEPALQRIAADPLAAAVAYGRRTGTCAICGRELTNHESIERGIGPICADKMGLL
jgi:hypothetical protein